MKSSKRTFFFSLSLFCKPQGVFINLTKVHTNGKVKQRGELNPIIYRRHADTREDSPLGGAEPVFIPIRNNTPTCESLLKEAERRTAPWEICIM